MPNALPPPEISVLLPVYNAARYLALAIESILAQSFRNFELLAIDDGSTDNSVEILESLSKRDARLRIIQCEHQGIVSTLNHGIELARAPLLARMDADDAAFPKRFEKQLAFLQSHPNVVAVGTGMLHVDPEGDALKIDCWAPTHREIELQLLQGGGGLPHPTAMMRTEAVRQAGNYRKKYEWIEDKDLWLRLGEIGELANMPETLLAYRVHEHSVSSKKEERQQQLWQQLLEETYQRRRLAATPPTRKNKIMRSGNNRRFRYRWMKMAARNGFWQSAKKHAHAILQENKFSAKAWWTLLKSKVVSRKQARKRQGQASDLPQTAEQLVAMLDSAKKK